MATEDIFLLKSEIRLHERARKQIWNVGGLMFRVCDVHETDMSYILSEVMDTLHYEELKKLFHRESAYRLLKNQKQMKTILVIFSRNASALKSYAKRYAYNTDANVNPGDVITSPQYDTPIIVDKVLDEHYTYFNRETGKLSNKIDNSFQFPIRTLKVVESSEDVIIGKLQK